MYHFISTLILISILITTGYSQTTHTYTPFKGEIFDIPRTAKNKDYGPHIKDFPKIGELEWDKIDVPMRHIDAGFPDVPKQVMFMIYFKNSITIQEEGCYEFFLQSDDKSLLWIENQLIVDNSGKQQRVGTADTAYFKKGTYPLRLWYSQIYPNHHGIVFTSKKVAECPVRTDDLKAFGPTTQKVSSLTPVSTVDNKISLTSSFLFDHNTFTLKPTAYAELDLICQRIKDASSKRILIVGHTDDVGQPEANLTLSIQRAAAVRDYLASKIELPVQYTVRGKGEQDPVATNETAEGRQQNRRVDLIID